MAQQLDPEIGAAFEAKRKIGIETAARHGVVSSGKDLGFEFRQNGALLCTKFMKVKVENGERTKTFYFEPAGVPLCLWNEECLAEPAPSNVPLIITEGEIDALSWLEAGASHVVSVPNGAPFDRPGEGDIIPTEDSAFKYLWRNGALVPGLEKFSKVVLSTDNDRKGLILRDELAVRLGRERCWYLTYPEGAKDANDVLVRFGSDRLMDMLADARPIVPNQLVKYSDIPVRASQQRFTTGWSEADRNLIIVPPELMVITGSPGAGKSQFTLALVCQLARLHGLKGAILQFEDNPDRNRSDLLRYARAWSNQDAQGIAGSPEAWVDRMFRTVAPSETLDADFNLDWILKAIEEAVTRHDAKWVVLDPWSEIEHVWKINETEIAYTNQALRLLKKITRKYQILLIIVAHPTKEVRSISLDDFSLYHVSGAAAWKNRADHGVIVWRDDQVSSETYIKIDKSKDHKTMGRPGIVRMKFSPEQASFHFVGHGK
jgi:twinkle protein